MQEVSETLKDLFRESLVPEEAPTREVLKDVEVVLDVVDQINGAFVVEPLVCLFNQGQLVKEKSLKEADELTIETIDGQANIERDPFNGRLYITPKSQDPIVSRAILETPIEGSKSTLIGNKTKIGIDTRSIPNEELRFQKAGGGACRARFELAGETSDIDLRVRAFMPTNVIPIDKKTRQLRWRDSLYFAYSKEIGNIRIQNNPQFRSRTILTTNQDEGTLSSTNFFPARGQNDHYFIIEFLDLGLSCFNKKPMIQSYSYTEWPPYSTVLSIDEPSIFYNTEDPDHAMLTINKNDMHIYDYDSIELECIESTISDNGTIHTVWQVHNQSTSAIQIRWFALGNYLKGKETIDQGAKMLGPNGTKYDSFKLEFNARISKSVLSQWISMNVVSINEPVVMGCQRLDFEFPKQ